MIQCTQLITWGLNTKYYQNKFSSFWDGRNEIRRNKWYLPVVHSCHVSSDMIQYINSVCANSNRLWSFKVTVTTMALGSSFHATGTAVTFLAEASRSVKLAYLLMRLRTSELCHDALDAWFWDKNAVQFPLKESYNGKSSSYARVTGPKAVISIH
jgi:hypothetical protein